MYPKFYDTVFRPLDAGHIRLIQLQPGPVSDPIICGLDDVHLENAPPYTALSYVWGSAAPVNAITVNGKAMSVGANLHSVLVHVRQESLLVTLWVDALCIFQDDRLEKSQQVQMMGEIFHFATTTFIWLGESSDNDQVVVDYLCQQRIPDSTDLELKNVPITALRYFFERSWFRRLWVLQEALLSKQPVAHCGRFAIPFSDVLRLSTDLVINNLANHRGDVFANCPLRRCMHEWDLLHEVVNKRGGWPLVYALPMTERMESTLFEDRVYALLGLATPTDRQSIKPDYSKSFESSQRELSAHLISSPEAPFEALHSMGFRKGSEVPTWGRNWNVSAVHSWFLTNPSRRKAGKRWSRLPEENTIRTGYEWLNLEASKRPWVLEKRSKIGSQFVQFSEDLWTCSIRGITVDYVDSVYVAPNDVLALMRECETWKNAVIQSATAWSNPEARLEAFSETLCLGNYRDTEGNNLTDCHTAHEAWIKTLDSLGRNGSPSSANTPMKNDFGHRVKRLCLGRSFYITRKGFVGLGPETTQVGDMVCYFERCNDLFILSPLSTTSSEAVLAAFVGETAVTGLMDGEGLEGLEPKDIVEYWIQ